MIRILNSVATHSRGYPSVHMTWADTTAEAFLAASFERTRYQRSVVFVNGNAAASRTWVEVDGIEVDVFMLPHDLNEAASLLSGVYRAIG